HPYWCIGRRRPNLAWVPAGHGTPVAQRAAVGCGKSSRARLRRIIRSFGSERFCMPLLKLQKTVGVKVGRVQVGGGAPIVVQSMTLTDTADARATAQQVVELAAAGSEMVRVTVNLPEAAAAVPEIKQRMIDAGCTVPLIGDFHYNGHLLLTKFPECARALDKYRINPGNVGTGRRRDEQFTTICKVAVEHGKPVRIGVNGGSLNQELVVARMQENTDRDLGKTSEEIINECMVLSALESTS